MPRTTTKYLLTAASLIVGSLTLTPSCATNNSSLFVVGVIDIYHSSCVAKGDATDGFLAQGTLDLAFTHSYTAFVLVGNQLTQQGSREQLRTETSRISLRGAEVKLSTVDGKPLGSYSTVGTGFVNEAAGDAPSYAPMAVNVIPAALTNLPGTVLAKIRVFGDTLGGQSVTSSELDFPITVCNGCLVNYDTPDTTQPANSPYKCATAVSTMQSSVAPPCILGQDVPFSCALCSASNDVCRDPLLNKSIHP